ncbi:MAG TPA: type 1 glutamine amidotransferase [Hanamia sp.]|nr:type 1 glutamine amidotransferase [Hanamia sp.]
MQKLRIHYFEHIFFEGPGSIEEWCKKNGHSLSSTKFYKEFTLPNISDIDWLIIMGGPMDVYDEQKFGWLATEKKFIKQAIVAGKTVIGICLGAQILAEIFRAKVYKNKYKEIGWFSVEWSFEATKSQLFEGIKSHVTVFHWHGDTFDLPENAIRLASSEACKNQAFLYNKKVLGLQFHLETTATSLQQMLENGKSELIPEKYIQPEEEIRNHQRFIEKNKEILFILLDRLAAEG